MQLLLRQMAPPSTSQPDTLFLQGPFAVTTHTDPVSLALARAKEKKPSLIVNFNYGHSVPIPLTKQMFSTLLSPANFPVL